MAIERRDLLDILDFQDSIADVTQDLAEFVDQRGMHLRLLVTDNRFAWEDCCLMLLPNWNVVIILNVMRVSVAAC